MAKPSFVPGPHNILLCGGIIGLAWFAYNLWVAFATGFTGQVLSQDTVCAQPLNNRCHYEHKVRLPDGTTTTVAMKGFAFTIEDFSVGNVIDKKPFAFGYLVNGQPRPCALPSSFFALLLASVAALLAWSSPAVRDRMKRAFNDVRA